jgi:hypothetical protein
MEVKGNITYLLAALSALRAEIKSPSLEVVFRSISVTDRGYVVPMRTKRTCMLCRWQLLQQQPKRAIKSDQDEKRTKLVEVFCTRLLEFTSRYAFPALCACFTTLEVPLSFMNIRLPLQLKPFATYLFVVCLFVFEDCTKPVPTQTPPLWKHFGLSHIH